ncbi:hypothetical protein [Phenylobacterium sp.]|uniref:hypothetical protein n=1 Tax=Phenylobacterium sp. TaxID=1871053 RepID=UPI002CCBF9EA|nr:hypothetical protein [Phenylobacterium sp.]HVI34027.1 hypothetical protein [Phenylobacterium sp.]
MNVPTRLAAAAALVIGSAGSGPAAAQFFPYPPPPPPAMLCPGPFGPVPCGAPVFIPPPPPMPMPMPPMPMPPGVGAPMPGGFPGAGGPPPGIPTTWQDAARAAGVPQDGVLMGQIGSQCGPDPACWAAAWAPIELERCQNGIGVPGGCFGPNGLGVQILTDPGQVLEDLGESIGDIFGW